MSIGQRIGELRREYGYSQEYIAEKLNVSRQAVSKWEQDLSAPDTYNLIALAELLGVSVEYLATGKKQEPAAEIPQPTPPPPQNGLNIQRIVGLILLGAGLLALILGLLFSKTLFTLSLLLILYGILCLTVRKYLWLVLLWISMLILFVITMMLAPIRFINGTDVTISQIISLIFGILFFPALIFTVKVILKNHKK